MRNIKTVRRGYKQKIVPQKVRIIDRIYIQPAVKCQTSDILVTRNRLSSDNNIIMKQIKKEKRKESKNV